MPKPETVPFDYTKAIEVTKKQRADLADEILEGVADLKDLRADFKDTGKVDRRLEKQIKIRIAQKKQRCLVLDKRINDMEKQQREQKKESPKDSDNRA